MRSTCASGEFLKRAPTQVRGQERRSPYTGKIGRGNRSSHFPEGRRGANKPAHGPKKKIHGLHPPENNWGGGGKHFITGEGYLRVHSKENRGNTSFGAEGPGPGSRAIKSDITILTGYPTVGEGTDSTAGALNEAGESVQRAENKQKRARWAKKQHGVEKLGYGRRRGVVAKEKFAGEIQNGGV